MLYRRRPDVLEAVQWTGDNFDEVSRQAIDSTRSLDKIRCPNGELKLLAGNMGAQGWVPVPVGHFVVRKPGDASDLWPVEEDYFARAYEAVV